MHFILIVWKSCWKLSNNICSGRPRFASDILRNVRGYDRCTPFAGFLPFSVNNGVQNRIQLISACLFHNWLCHQLICVFWKDKLVLKLTLVGTPCHSGLLSSSVCIVIQGWVSCWLGACNHALVREMLTFGDAPSLDTVVHLQISSKTAQWQ